MRDARTGFCFGVKRAVAMAEDALKGKGPIYSLGSIIHNRQVVEALSKKGLMVIGDVDDISNGTVIVSSHGLSPKTAARISAKGLRIIDTTCPFVRKAQMTARRLAEEGYAVVVVGDSNHPEIRALIDFVPKNIFVVRNRGDVKKLDLRNIGKVSVISQTTQSTENFLDVVRALAAKKKGLKVFNTICRDAEERQAYARSLAAKSDLMLVVGGSDSANTRRLYEVCKKASAKTRLIETEKDLRKSWFRGVKSVGVASGASTPAWVIEKVIQTISKKLKVKIKKF